MSWIGKKGRNYEYGAFFDIWNVCRNLLCFRVAKHNINFFLEKDFIDAKKSIPKSCSTSNFTEYISEFILILVLLQSKQTIEKLQMIVSSDGRFRALRDALHRCDPPCIPYLGMYLTDLSFIEEGTPNFTQEGLLNFSKMRMVKLLILICFYYLKSIDFSRFLMLSGKLDTFNRLLIKLN